MLLLLLLPDVAIKRDELPVVATVSLGFIFARDQKQVAQPVRQTRCERACHRFIIGAPLAR